MLWLEISKHSLSLVLHCCRFQNKLSSYFSVFILLIYHPRTPTSATIFLLLSKSFIHFHNSINDTRISFLGSRQHTVLLKKKIHNFIFERSILHKENAHSFVNILATTTQTWKHLFNNQPSTSHIYGDGYLYSKIKPFSSSLVLFHNNCSPYET